jgi:hypothetical protein
MPEKYAILIASSEYSAESGLARLRCPENDVEAVDELLRSPDFGRFTKTFVFRNASSDEIRPALNSVLANAEKDDLVLIYFSGHGKLNRLGHLCLATANTDCKALEATSVRAATIKSYFDLSYSRKKILLLDCCFSGAAGEEFAPTKGGIDGELRSMSQGQGTFIMTASSSVQTAVEKEGDQYGLFTKHLVQGIRSGEADKNEDGFVDMQELYEYVHAKVREEGAQEPMQWGQDVKGKLIISRSGRESREKRIREAKSTLFRLAAEERLTDCIVFEAVNVLSIPRQDMTAKDQECSLLVRQLVSAKISPPAFIEQWVRACLVQPAAPEPKKKADVSIESARIILPASNLQKGSKIGQYINHGDGTITDTKTGLMWKRCSEGLSGVNCEEGKVKKYTWTDAVKRFKDVEYAGYADWRLPTIDELKTLVYCSTGKDEEGDCKDGSEKPTINRQAFPNTEQWAYWSGSPDAGASDGAWYVFFNYGGSGAGNRYSGYSAVRLVRGGQ